MKRMRYRCTCRALGPAWGALALVAQFSAAQSLDGLEVVATISVPAPSPAVFVRDPGGYGPVSISPTYLLPRTTPQTVTVSGGRPNYRHYFCLSKALEDVRPSTHRACTPVADRVALENVALTAAMIDFGGVAWHIAVGTRQSLRAQWIPIPAVSAVTLSPTLATTETEYTARIHPDANGLRVTPTGAGTITVRLGAGAETAVASGKTHAIDGLASGANTLTVKVEEDGQSKTFTVTLERAVLADAAVRAAVRRTLGKAPDATLSQNDLGELRTLRLAFEGVTDLAGLRSAVNLTSLSLAGNGLDDVAELAMLPALATLNLSDNALADISPLAGLQNLRTLLLDDNAVADLAPLATLTELRELSLDDNAVADLSPLAELVALEQLSLRRNRVAHVRPLGMLQALRYLHLSGNRIENITGLASLRQLTRLDLADNAVADVWPLASLHELERLNLERNAVRDISRLRGLKALTSLRLGGNVITDARPLATDRALGAGDAVGLVDNPLDRQSIETHVPALRSKGAAALAGWPVPFFPAAADESGRQGFLRIINRSNAAGEVRILAVDDAGVRADPVRLAIGPRQARHVNSGDLERGNPDKGLPQGVGEPSAGAWRLLVASALDIEVLAAIRTPDGFLTSMHDALPRDAKTESLRAVVFNPRRNRRQVSSLRLINPGVVDERVAVWGQDDDGFGRLAAGWVVPAGGALTLTARQLESYRLADRRPGLGRGVGKWRLAVHARWPVRAMSLLASPTGHLANLSRAPANRDADGTWRLALFPAVAPSAARLFRQGFARIANRSGRGCLVWIEAVDDAGVRAGPVKLRLGPLQTVHINSEDLQNGNEDKGLAEGVGGPTSGDWRLALTSNLDIRAYAYVRTGDGFLTAMHDVAPVTEGETPGSGVARVSMFNPGSNRRQESLLRLVNDGEENAQVSISGMDDAGERSATVAATIPAGQARTFSAAALETGSPLFVGALGDGEGKWRLSVAFDQPLTVMSLLQSPTGHLTNLSSTTKP